jgi:hypothetical protein
MGTVENPATKMVDNVLSVYSGSDFREITGSREIFVPANQFLTHTGSGALTGTAAGSGGIPGWALDTTTDETLSTVLELPDSWTGFDAAVVWSNASTGAGGVRWDINYESLAIGAAGAAGTTASATGTASTTAFLTVATAVVSGGLVTPGNLFRMRVNRDADHAGDTLANDASFHGVRLVRVVV